MQKLDYKIVCNNFKKTWIAQKISSTMSHMKLFCEDVTSNLRRKAEKELGETEEVRKQTLEELRKCIKDEPDFYPRMDDAFLLRYLRVRKFDVNKAFKTLKNYYTLKARYSGAWTDIKPTDVKPVLEQGYVTALEYRDHNNVAIGYTLPSIYNTEKFSIDQNVACFLLINEVCFASEATQIAGFSMIFNLAGFTLRMIKYYASPTLVYKILGVIENCLPCRIKAIHVLNEPLYVDICYNLVKLFISKKLQERVHFHGSDLSSLHKYISPDVLPEELGGKQGPLSKYSRKFNDFLLSKDDYFSEINKYGYKGETLAKLTKKKL